MTKTYVFVSGCPRSGTTGLTTLLNWHPHVLLGQERFASLLNRIPAAFVPELFEPARFASVQRGDCGYDSLESSALVSPFARRKKFDDFRGYACLGDKIPKLYEKFDVFGGPAWAGRSVHVIHIVRDAFDVAASYETRSRNPGDRWTADARQGIADWIAAVRAVERYLSSAQSAFRLSIVCYESLFERGEEGMRNGMAAIYDRLALSPKGLDREGIHKVWAHTQKKQEMRKGYPELRQELAERLSEDDLRLYMRVRRLALFS